MHELMMSMSDIKETEKTLMGWVKNEVAKGVHGENCCDMDSLGDVIDAIKDLAETKEKCWKAKYYECLVTEMESYSEHDGPMGYDNWRYASTGRFAPKGHGERSGYRPEMMMHEEEDIEQYRGKAGYPGRMSVRTTPRTNPNVHGTIRMGYPMDETGWPHDTTAYDHYREAKRHYTQTGDDSYKHEMNGKIEESVGETMESFREMWKDASPDVRKKMKTNIEGLAKEFDRM